MTPLEHIRMIERMLKEEKPNNGVTRILIIVLLIVTVIIWTIALKGF